MKSPFPVKRFRRLTLWISLLLLAGCATPAASRRPLYAVLSAYGPETKANEAALIPPGARVTTTRIHGTEFKRVEFEGHDLLLFPSGVSMVNAAMNVQLALDRFPVTHVLFAGIAGSMNPAHAIGDVVVPERWYHHSEGAYLNPKRDGSGYVLPQYFEPPYENFGYFFPDHVWALREGMDKPERQEFFPVDPELLAAARRASQRFPNLKLRYESRDCTVSVGGNGISGPVFMDNREYRKWAFRVWKAECLDMESTAVAQVCWVNRKPCLIVRSLSDLAGGQEGINAEDFTEDIVSRHASEVLREIIRDLPR
jgi:adenosylhomocysteine nucleosidase